mgnify:CR=1 FL=1
MITVFANMSNGTEEQFKVIGDTNKILNFIENYEGDDLGNDLYCEDFVEDFEETGVIIKK